MCNLIGCGFSSQRWLMSSLGIQNLLMLLAVGRELLQVVFLVRKKLILWVKV